MTSQAQERIKGCLEDLSKYCDFRLGPSTIYDIFVNPTEATCNRNSKLHLCSNNIEPLHAHISSLCFDSTNLLKDKTRFEFGWFNPILAELKPDLKLVEFDALQYDLKSKQLRLGQFACKNDKLEQFRRKQTTMFWETFQKVGDGTLTSEEREHLSYYVVNKWTFLYNREPYQITDHFKLVKMDFTIPIASKSKAKTVCKQTKETSLPTALSPHILVVVGSRTLTLPTGRELSEQEFTRLTEVVKVLTQ